MRARAIKVWNESLKGGKFVKPFHSKPALNTVQIMEKQRAASQAKLWYHERKLKTLQSHLERGTISKTLRLKTFPKMKTPQGQALIHEACDEVQKIMLIQMVEEEQQALAQAQKEYKSLSKKDTIKSLRKELKSLRAQLLKLQTPDSTQTQEGLSEQLALDQKVQREQ